MKGGDRPTLRLEGYLLADYPGEVVVGMDEVGCASFAGPLVAGAVALPPKGAAWYSRVDDSKRLTRTQREELSAMILEDAVCGLGAVTNVEIDQIGHIMKSRTLAMRRALAACRRQLGPVAVSVIVDDAALSRAQFTPHGIYVNRGDQQSISVAAASVVAKVARDHYMAGLGRLWPGYGWEHNVGYGTQEHWQALKEIGITPEHRMTWKPLRQLVQEIEEAS
jgi:ribonuclease HII